MKEESRNQLTINKIIMIDVNKLRGAIARAGMGGENLSSALEKLATDDTLAQAVIDQDEANQAHKEKAQAELDQVINVSTLIFPPEVVESEVLEGN